VQQAALHESFGPATTEDGNRPHFIGVGSQLKIIRQCRQLTVGFGGSAYVENGMGE
jgi:hypothetical protein